MDPKRREAFNRVASDELFGKFMGLLEKQVGPFPFRVAETPLFLTPALVQRLAKDAEAIVAQLSEPAKLTAMKRIVPVHYDVPGMDALPHCVQVDFALCRDENAPPGTQGIVGKVVELQGFPSLYALESMMAEAWKQVLTPLPGLDADWTCYVNLEREQALDIMRRTIVSDYDPKEVVLVDLEPEKQKTWPDFVATKLLFGVESVCITKLIKEGRKLFREVDGKRIPVKRIYNRIVFDEIETKQVKPPFLWNDDLDITWCAHPNWYWVWSKYSLPYIDHPAVPSTRFLSELHELPEDLENYVLKPLFSFAGGGVVVDVTPDAIHRVPAAERHRWVLQRKIEYAPVVRMPEGSKRDVGTATPGPGVKAEVRVMLMRPAHETRLVPLIYLVRMSRGKMLGVDYNKNLTWVGGSVGLWEKGT